MDRSIWFKAKKSSYNIINPVRRKNNGTRILFLFDNNSKTDSKTTVGKIGKSVIGGTIDTLSNVGPLDGMWLGAKIGAKAGPQGLVVGTLAGLGLGTINLAGSLFFPDQKKALYDGVKNFAYGAVDVVESGVESIGKGIHQGLETVKSVGKSVSDFFNGGLKAASSLFG